ncbi:hypothetical protein [Desulfococcus sp.]|uniref:hypothetical protein n=1 Tax=Desulfococcus sp. TaxID=2025834 RepID=UPI003593B611
MSGRMGVKRCPYCSTNLNKGDTRCFSCKRKVGEANKDGIAKKPFDWKGYGMSILATIAFIGFMWWAFFRK